MAWENVLKKQSDRLTTLLDDAVIRWRDAKGKATAGNYQATEAASDMVCIWNNLLNFWWGPFDSGDPVVPTLAISAAANAAGPVPGDCRLLEDTTQAAVSITALGLIGAAGSIGTGDIAHNVIDGSKLIVNVSNLPATAGLYQGLALKGNDPIAVIIVKVT